jgi:hypothetical protein
MELALQATMVTPQNTYALDRRRGSQPAWLDDSDLDDDPPAPEWPFDAVPGARQSLESSHAVPPADLSATFAPASRRRAAVPALAIAALMAMTFGVGWWVGWVHPPRDQEPSVARTVRHPAKAVRAEAQMAPAIVTIATASQAPTVPAWGPSPARAPLAPVARVAPAAAPVALVASEKPTEPVARVFVPTEL